MSTNLISDGQSLVGAKTRFDSPIRIYDDGFGPLFIHRDSMGITGIVRAQTWEDAYSICEDEFFPEANETVEELRKEYNFKREERKMVRVNGVERLETPADYLNGYLMGEFVKWITFVSPCEDENGWVENALFQEAFGFRPNGPNKDDKIGHGIYAKDLNGDALDLLTPELLAALEIKLEIKGEEDEE